MSNEQNEVMVREIVNCIIALAKTDKLVSTLVKIPEYNRLLVILNREINAELDRRANNGKETKVHATQG